MLRALFLCNACTRPNRLNLRDLGMLGLIFVGSMTLCIVSATNFKRNTFICPANLDLTLKAKTSLHRGNKHLKLQDALRSTPEIGMLP